MPFQFSKHYSVEEARALLPQVRQWLDQLDHLKQRATKLGQRVESLLDSGNDIGGPSVNELARTLGEMKGVLSEFASREILVKDVERGLIDFPSLREGREVFLCWEKDEEEIEFWHEIDSGYPGRERL
jgi:hypothetical protein